MSPVSEADSLLISKIREGGTEAWNELIGRFEGRLIAFVESRLGKRAASEDVVQETFVGFLTSLPNYDDSRPLESYLFSIAAHKLTDHLRREGRRPALLISQDASSQGDWEIMGPARHASSIYRSGERKRLEEQALADALSEQLNHWRNVGDWTKIKCMELLFVAGWANKDVATELTITEQQVANFKFDFLARLRTTLRKSGLSQDVFPELYESS
jgi:RNA polymerase sigma-70 factor (ECF subfamily)